MRAVRFPLACFLSVLISMISCTDLNKNLPTPASGKARVHLQGWNDSLSSNFHGTVLKSQHFDLSTCMTCHAKSFEGGISGVRCYDCHKSYPHSNGWIDSRSADFHGNFIRTSGWDMLQCKPCHGQTYSGGITAVSCLTCHTKQNGPENCTTCHGSANVAPPKDLNGNITTSARGVGAHQDHLMGSNLASPVLCKECHIVPTSVYGTGHIDASAHAHVTFNGPRGTMATARGTFVPNPSYDFASLTCENTFCHGNWKLEKSSSQYDWAYTDTIMTGSNYSPLWTGSDAQDVCGTCHGLPPAGHLSAGITISDCAGCHYGVVDSRGNIIDSTKHMNGKVNVFGEERTF